MPPMSQLRLGLHGGLVSARDRGELEPGELQQATGIYYKPGDRRAHVLGGRGLFGDTGTGAKVKGIALCLFDAGTDYLLAFSGTAIYAGTPGVSATLSALASGLSASATEFTACHANDRHFLGNGVDRNLVLEADGTTRGMGMLNPVVKPVVTVAAAAGTNFRPSSSSAAAFANAANTYDTDQATYASATLAASGSAVGTWTGMSSNTGSSRKLVIVWALGGASAVTRSKVAPSRFGDAGASAVAGYTVTVKFELNEGSSYSTIYESTLRTYQEVTSLQIPVTDATNLNGMTIRATLTYTSGKGAASLRIYDIRIGTASTAANFTTTTGMYYAIAEYDQSRNLPSNIGEVSSLVTLTAQNQATIALPGTAGQQNTNTTHWIVYRTGDGGASPADLGVIAYVPVAQTSYRDEFLDWMHSEQPYPLYPLIPVSDPRNPDNEPLYFNRDTAPPAFVRIRPYRGGLMGFREDAPRTLHYNVPGLEESWPEIYTISSFPFDEHDRLLDGVELGDEFIIMASGVMIRLDDVPRSINGQFNAGAISKIKGAPGGVGRHALCAFSVEGEARAAWITHQGIYQTNGHTIQRISDDIDWGAWSEINKSKWLLRWDSKRLCLVFAYSSVNGGENDRYQLGHMAMLKQSGQPTWGGEHYGRIVDVASGEVEGTPRLYSAHGADGKVYLEDYGTTDASNAYDSAGTNPVILTLGRLYHADWIEWSALRAKIGHTDFGAAKSCTLSWRSGRDVNEYETAKIVTVALDGHRSSVVDIGRGAEWHEPTITYTGNTGGAFSDILVEVRGLTSAGKVAVG